MLNSKIIAFTIACAIFRLTAADPYSSMDIFGKLPDKSGKPVQYGHGVYDRAKNLPHLKKEEWSRNDAFQATFCDLNAPRGKNFVYPYDTFIKKRELFSAKGDYLSIPLTIFLSKPLDKLEIKTFGLKGPGEIPQDRIRFFTVVPRDGNPKFHNAHLLLSPRLHNLKGGEMIDLLAFIDIPETTSPGIYKGKITISSGGKSQEMTLSLRVMDFKLPEAAGSFGFYLYGNLYGNEQTDVPQKGFTPQNLERYFRFYRSRRLNSVTLYDYVPDLRYIDGKVTGKFTGISQISDAMKKSGLKGKLIIDLRDITYWCNAVARKLETLGDQVPRGDLGITMKQRKSQAKPYPEKAKRIFAEVLEYLNAEAKREEWTDYLLLVEEEIGNRFPVKLAGYASFMPVLMKVCPERAVVVDNEIGYGRSQEVDRGARDKVPYRQYNSWTEAALENAGKDQAQILLFNYNPSRLSFGFLPQSMNAVGCHQWADLWDSWNFQWQYTRLSEDGVVSSLEVERIHEGCVDYAACEFLKKLIQRKEQAGETELAEKGKQVLKKVTTDLPCQGDAARNLSAILKDENLNVRRWQIFCAIEELLRGKSPQNKTVKGSPAIKAFSTGMIEDKANQYVIKVGIGNGKMEEHAAGTEKFWSEVIGPLRYLPEKEAQLKALSSTLEEYKRRNTPSWSIVQLAALPEGLAVLSSANHVLPNGKFRSSRRDNDGDLWKDDCFELFFELPNKEVCRLIFNAAGAKTFLRKGIPVPAEEIRSFVKSPINPSGGTRVKLLVPWSYFGMEAPPYQGTVWKFNAGREFHTYDMILSWARVSDFHEQEKWGHIIFSNTQIKPLPVNWSKRSPVHVVLCLDHTIIRGNNLEFTINYHWSKTEKNSMNTLLLHEDGTLLQLGECPVPAQTSRVVLDTAGLKTGKWELTLKHNGIPGSKPAKLNFEILPSPCD